MCFMHSQWLAHSGCSKEHLLDEWLALSSRRRGAVGSKNQKLKSCNPLSCPFSPCKLQAPPSSHVLPRVQLEEGKNIGRNSAGPETDGRNIMGGAKLRRTGASGQEPERKEGFP